MSFSGRQQLVRGGCAGKGDAGHWASVGGTCSTYQPSSLMLGERFERAWERSRRACRTRITLECAKRSCQSSGCTHVIYRLVERDLDCRRRMAASSSGPCLRTNDKQQSNKVGLMCIFIAILGGSWHEHEPYNRIMLLRTRLPSCCIAPSALPTGTGRWLCPRCELGVAAAMRLATESL